YRAWWPCWMPIFFEAGMRCGTVDFVDTVITVAEEAAARNPEVATLYGVAANLRGLFAKDLATVAESAQILQQSPRPIMRALGAESYGTMLLHAGDQQAGLEQLDEAWDHYDYMGATALRAAVQRVMRHAGARRPKWFNHASESAHKPLTNAERRVGYFIPDRHTHKTAAQTPCLSVNTLGTHIPSVYWELRGPSPLPPAPSVAGLAR